MFKAKRFRLKMGGCLSKPASWQFAICCKSHGGYDLDMIANHEVLGFPIFKQTNVGLRTYSNILRQVSWELQAPLP